MRGSCGAAGDDNMIAPSSAPGPQRLSPDRTTCGRKEAASTVAQDWGAGLKFMDILKRLFEEHFRLPVENLQPLQGDLGGSGRKIIPLKRTSEIRRCLTSFRRAARVTAFPTTWWRLTVKPRPPCLAFRLKPRAI